MTDTALQHWLRRIQSLHPREVELGLERVGTVAGGLGLSAPGVPVVTVAGTNGKGSTIAVLEALLLRAGHRPGTFTSPHLLRFNERIRVAGAEAPDSEIVAAFAAIETARAGVPLTYFEFATLAALWVFRQRGADFLLLEVGLGGRLDAVNAVDPSLAVITSIDLDHQDWLGSSRAAIALEKAGILRPAIPVVVADPRPPVELLDRIEAVQAAPAVLLGRDMQVGASAGGWQIDLWRAGAEPRRLPPLPQTSALLPANVCAAAQAALLLGIELRDAWFPQVLTEAAPLARRQSLQVDGMQLVLDVAHNPAAVEALLEYLAAHPCSGRTVALFSAMADKDVAAMIARAAGQFDAWFVAGQPGNERAMTAAGIAALLRAEGVAMISENRNLRQGLGRARRMLGATDRLVIFGSFYTVAEVLPALERRVQRDEAL